jgi:hypothetical protein
MASSVFVGSASTDTAELAEFLPDDMRASLEAGDEVSLAASFADTFVDPHHGRAPNGKSASHAGSSNRRARTSDKAPSLQIDGVQDRTASANALSEVGCCKHCQAELEAGNLFCVECGARI